MYPLTPHPLDFRWTSRAPLHWARLCAYPPTPPQPKRHAATLPHPPYERGSTIKRRCAVARYVFVCRVSGLICCRVRVRVSC